MTHKISKEEYDLRRAYGLRYETELQEQIEKIVGCDLKKTNRYAKFDYTSKSSIVELKSRRVKSTDYKETLINNSKLENLDEVNKDIWFFFKYTDCLKYIKYDKERFDTHVRTGFNKALNPNMIYAYIPIDIMSTA